MQEGKVHRRKDDSGLGESEEDLKWHLKWILLGKDEFKKST